MGAHVGYEDDAQEQIQALLVLVLHLLRPLLRHGRAAARGPPHPSVRCCELGILVILPGTKKKPTRGPNCFLVDPVLGRAASPSLLIFFGLDRVLRPIDPLAINGGASI